MRVHHPDKSGEGGNAVAVMLNQARDYLAALLTVMRLLSIPATSDVLQDEACDDRRSQAVPQRYLHLIVKYLDKEIELRVLSESLVGQIKETISSEVEVPAQKQRLYMPTSGIELHDLRSVGSYKWALSRPTQIILESAKPDIFQGDKVLLRVVDNQSRCRTDGRLKERQRFDRTHSDGEGPCQGILLLTAGADAVDAGKKANSAAQIHLWITTMTNKTSSTCRVGRKNADNSLAMEAIRE
eukprot:756658-Hanusia_phi.AAC.6